MQSTLTGNTVAWASEGILEARSGCGEGTLPCTDVPRRSIWNTLLAHSLGSMGASVETPTGNSGSCTVTLSFATRLPAWRDTICSLSFPLACKSDTAGGKALSTWPGGATATGQRHVSINTFKTIKQGPRCG